MNTTDFNGKQYTMQDNGDGSITLVPVEVKAADGDWKPVMYEDYWAVDKDGDIRRYSWANDEFDRAHLGFGNIFPSKAQAKKAAEYMRRSNAIICACLLVDPDFVPDWDNHNEVKYFPTYRHDYRKWCADSCGERDSQPASCSTYTKCEQACALLTKWGVK